MIPIRQDKANTVVHVIDPDMLERQGVELMVTQRNASVRFEGPVTVACGALLRGLVWACSDAYAVTCRKCKRLTKAEGK